MTRLLCSVAVAVVLAVASSSVDGRPQVDVQFPFGRVNVNKGPAGTQVDVQHPAGSVNVNKGLGGGAQVDVQHPAGSVNVNKGLGGASSRASPSPQNDLLTMLRSLLGLNNVASGQQRSAATASAASFSSANKADVDVNYPGGLVNVRKASPDGPKQVDVVYPGGSVNVGGKGGNVDVAFPGGYVKLDPREPGKPRSGVVVFPFGSVRFG